MGADEPTGERPDTTVARVPSVAIAEMLAGALTDQGIPANVAGADRAYPSMDWAYGVQVRVPASRVDEARAIIEADPDDTSGDGFDPGPASDHDPGEP